MVRRLALYDWILTSDVLEGSVCDCIVALLSWRDVQLATSVVTVGTQLARAGRRALNARLDSRAKILHALQGSVWLQECCRSAGGHSNDFIQKNPRTGRFL